MNLLAMKLWKPILGLKRSLKGAIYVLTRRKLACFLAICSGCLYFLGFCGFGFYLEPGFWPGFDLRHALFAVLEGAFLYLCPAGKLADSYPAWPGAGANLGSGGFCRTRGLSCTQPLFFLRRALGFCCHHTTFVFTRFSYLNLSGSRRQNAGAGRRKPAFGQAKIYYCWKRYACDEAG